MVAPLKLASVALLVVVPYGLASMDRPLAPPLPAQITCRSGGLSGTIQVSCKAEASSTDEVAFGVARADDGSGFAHVHYVVDIASDGVATAVIPGLTAGVEYKVTARAHSKGSSEGWNEKWSAMTSESASCKAGIAQISNHASVSHNASAHAAIAKSTWIEVYRYRGPSPAGHMPGSITDYNLPDFLDNHCTGDVNKQMSRWDYPGASGQVDYNVVSYTRYCVEVLEVSLEVSVHAVGSGQGTKTSGFSNYLACDTGKCHCPNKYDAFTLSSEVGDPEAYVDESCPSGQPYCNCRASDLELGAKYTGSWAFSPPFTDSAWMGWQKPFCGWGHHSYPCHGQADPKGYFYHHPQEARCKTGQALGENGCTWKRSPLMHTLSVQQLLDAGAIGKRPGYREMQISEELECVENGKRAFAAVGATPCGYANQEQDLLV